MVDIGLDSNFDLRLDDRNDLPTVRGRAEFEQRLAVVLTAAYDELVGSVDQANLPELLSIQARRVAQRFEDVDRVAQMQVTPSEDEPNTIDVTVIYATGGDFSFEVTE
jgi:hypothetical protein